MLNTFLKRLLSSLLLLAAAAIHAETEPLNRIVAVVNDDVVLESELEAKLGIVREQLRAQNTDLPPDDVLRQQVLERVIVDKLQLQLAAANNIQIDDETLASNLRNIAEQNGMSMDQFRATLENEGQDFAAFREEIRNQILIARLHQQMVGNRINVSEQEIDNQIANAKTSGSDDKEYRLSHILIPVPEGAGPDAIRAADHQRAEQVEPVVQVVVLGVDVDLDEVGMELRVVRRERAVPLVRDVPEPLPPAMLPAHVAMGAVDELVQPLHDRLQIRHDAARPLIDVARVRRRLRRLPDPGYLPTAIREMEAHRPPRRPLPG